MGATNSNQNSTGRKNFYNVSYGKLSTRVKDAPENGVELVEADLKSKIQSVEQIDFRNKYVNKDKGDYPYQVFYDSISGDISDFQKVDNEHGVFFNVIVEDKDGDTSYVQMNFYSKYAENLMNRLLNANSFSNITLFPYAIPNSAEIEGQTKTFYTQGVSLKVDGVKVEPKYKNDDKELPPTEVVKVKGKATTSRDNRVDFLFEQLEKVEIGVPTPRKSETKVVETPAGIQREQDNLPF